MQKNTLLIVSMVLSCLGIAVLFFLRPEVSPQIIEINGTVEKVSNQESISFITFVPDDFLVVSFKNLNTEPGKHVLRGRLQQYQGRLEFVVEEIK